MNRSILAAVLAPLLACTPFTSTSADTSTSTSPNTSTWAEAPAERPTTVPDTETSPTTTHLTYTDELGTDRTIQVELRLPDGSTGDGPRPVVVWSHGGGYGKRSTANVGERWGRAFNDAGFAFVAIAHTGRSEEERLDLCDAVGVSDCSVFGPLRWDRPHDIAVTIDWVESVAADHDLDADQLVLGGHSGGAMGVLNTVGLPWEHESVLQPPVDVRPIAVLAASPPGAETRNVTAAGLSGIDVPMIWLSGAGDTTNSTPALDRQASFELLAAGQPAVLLWVEREEVRHGGFNLDVTSCERAGGTNAQCRRAARTIADVGVGFVDEVVRADGVLDVDGFVAELGPRLPQWSELLRSA